MAKPVTSNGNGCPHQVVNPSGVLISLPMMAIDALSAIHCIQRPNGIPVITSAIYHKLWILSILQEGPQPIKAMDYSKPVGVRHNGRANRLLNMVGLNVEGCEWVDCQCRSCEQLAEDADRTGLPHGVE